MLRSTLLSMKQQKIARRLHKLDRRLLKYPTDKKTLDAKKSLLRQIDEVNYQLGNLRLKKRMKRA